MPSKHNHITFYKNSITGSTGARKAMIDIANELVKAGREVSIVVMKGPLTPFFAISPKVKLVNLALLKNRPVWAKIPVIRSLYSLLKVRRALQKDPSKIIISFSRGMSFKLIRASIGLDKNIIASQRNSLYAPGRKWYTSVLEKIYYRRAAFVTSNSESVIEELKAIVSPAKLVHTPNPFILPEFEPQPAVRKPYILAVGRLHHRKGYDVLFQALHLIKNQLNGWRLRIVGDGPLEAELKQMAINLSIDEHIDWLGVHPNPKPFFQESGMYVLPSRYEGVPNAMLDAMAYGLPIIISAVEGSLEYIEHEKNGLVFPIDDRQTLATAIKDLIDNDHLRTRLGNAAFADAKKIAKKNTIRVWKEVFESI